MILVLLLGCYTLTESHCEAEVREVPDDELLDLGFTVAAILDRIEPQQIHAVDLSGATVPLDVSITRGEGPALVDDTTEITEVVGGFGPNTSNTWIDEDPTCGDAVEVPVTLTMSGEGVSVVGPALLANDPANAEAGRFEVLRTLDLSTDLVPAGRHGAAVSGEARVVHLDSAVYELEVRVVTEDGAREIVLWYRSF
ncbi:MAG: hypothetical protein Q8P18_05440 [Pseudomonadota bacterium]|nr:hypothetical protein [Pseudomonadota bacterium]